jgi:16S rRNA (guanine(966)-N(2))-methyltransferase RsmD
MRVIAGEFRGLKLNSPKNRDIRPTTDRIKEDVFNILAPYLSESRFLDLFSGSGAMAVEAVSRGCMNATMIEGDRSSIALIRSNIEKTKSPQRFCVIHSDVIKFLQHTDQSYDVIYIDPPYRLQIIEKVFEIIRKRDIITDNGVVVLEQGRKMNSLIKSGISRFSEKEVFFHNRLFSQAIIRIRRGALNEHRDLSRKF